jgi:parvulin-like peptidyl-prolyl isomerase
VDALSTRLKTDPLQFEEIAKTNSKDSFASAGGAMGWQHYYELALDFDKTDAVDKIIALKQGEISEPLEGKFGWMIFRCEEAAVPINTALEEDRKAVRSYLDRYEAGTVQDYALQKAKDFVSRARQEGFSKTAAALKLTVDATSYFPMNYQNVFILKPVQSGSGAKTTGATALGDALYSEEFFKGAFSIKSGEVSEPIVLGQAVVVLSLKDERAVSESDATFMSDYHTYFAQQSDGADLDAKLMDQTKLVDKFDETFQKYLTTSSAQP